MAASNVALITGAYRGLGYEVAKELLAKGYEVFITARREEEGRKAAEKLAKGGGKVHFIRLGVTDPAGITQAAKEVAGQTDHLNVLINNAGIFPDGDRTILDVSEALLKQSFTTNTVGAVLVSQ